MNVPINEGLLNNAFFGNLYIKEATVLVFGFLMGTIPFGLAIGWAWFNTDIRTQGSGNIGAANALRTWGPKVAVPVLLLDAFKGYVPVFLAMHNGHAQWGVATGIAAMLGHCFSPWLRFRGGKGVATMFGVALALSAPATLALVAVWLIGALSTGFSSVGSLSAAGVAFVPMFFAIGEPGLVFGGVSALLIEWTHRENLMRLFDGNENPMRRPKTVATAGRAATDPNPGRLS